MNIFGTQGFNEFVLALGYRSDVIKRWLLDLNDLDGDITIDALQEKQELIKLVQLNQPPWLFGQLKHES